MFVSTNHLDFNNALNKFAGTNAVSYSAPWAMSTRTGRQYLSQNHDIAGRKFACSVLDKRVQLGSKLATENALEAPTPSQKTALLAMRDSKSQSEFNAALRLAVCTGALKPAAMSLFSCPHVIETKAHGIFPVSRNIQRGAKTSVPLNVAGLNAVPIKVTSSIGAKSTVTADKMQVDEMQVDEMQVESKFENTMQAESNLQNTMKSSNDTLQMAARTPGMSTMSLVAPQLKKRRKTIAKK